VSARLAGPVTLTPDADGRITACFGEQAVVVGQLSQAALARAGALAGGLMMAALVAPRTAVDAELAALLRRLARHGLIEYAVARTRGGEEEAVVEPQTPDYWPEAVDLDPGVTVALSRFAYMRRRGSDLVVESPRAGALVRLRNPATAAMLAGLVRPARVSRLRRQEGFPGTALFGLLVQCGMVFATTAGDDGGRLSEGGGELVLWDFHDLLFHARSTAGRHANPLGGMYRYAGTMPALPAVRPSWPGKPIDLAAVAGADLALPPLAALLRERHSTRAFDPARPITLAELARFLDGTARVLWHAPGEHEGDGGEIAPRPYPSAGSSYELEAYVAVDRCEGLGRGFYHYDAGRHALVPVGAKEQDLKALFGEAMYAMAVAAAPQVVIVIAARFGRVSWKYASLAYSLVLKDCGVLLQTFYLMMTQMGLGGCATGICNVDLFARLTGIAFHVEGPVGEFALGRPAPPDTAPADAGDGVAGA